MCERGNEIVVPCRYWMAGTRNDLSHGIAIDSCIAETIEAAWDAGVETLGSCCGHANKPPSVVLADGTPPEAAREWLPGFTLHQWRLTDVTDKTGLVDR